MIADRLPADELPNVLVEAPELLLHREKRFRVLDRRVNLQFVANNARVREELLDFARIVSRNFVRLEIIESAPVVLSLFQDGNPAQAGLGAFENQELEQQAVVVNRHAPFMVMIGDVKISFGPGAAGQILWDKWMIDIFHSKGLAEG
jgi:hypothetical protein